MPREDGKIKMENKIKVGILSFQGSVEEHKKILNTFNDVEPIEVKTFSSLNKVDGIILPGGESTTISKLLKIFNLSVPLKERIKSGMPVWGTCAGLILLAKNIEKETPHLALMDISVKRNAYGTQINSFVTTKKIDEVSKEKIPLVFIRAPWIESVESKVKILLEINGHIVAAKQKNMLATSFHPELTDNNEFHKYFINMIREYKNKNFF